VSKQNELHSNSRTGNITTISNAVTLLVADSWSDGWSNRNESAYALVIILVSIVNRTILIREWSRQGPLSSFRRLDNCGCAKGQQLVYNLSE
jgi:hypothetical protein